ncbi:hypothetical protein CF165_26675 [Amycolatopsis vastitatis]|uniref:FAD dependent oxidoreductase domain-containing protein n=1 Tax=Amycolatopsis vastitatis TaxID=1905142 RepID=A0A229SZR8_9PSEU|nr:hypothetical protein CF165_26675 [Amycolatopsis vastitatis]
MMDYDVLVIGSGFGGSVTALRLTEKGYRVGVLETGPRGGRSAAAAGCAAPAGGRGGASQSGGSRRRTGSVAAARHIEMKRPSRPRFREGLLQHTVRAGPRARPRPCWRTRTPATRPS